MACLACTVISGWVSTRATAPKALARMLVATAKALLFSLVLPGPEPLRLRQGNKQRWSSGPLPKTHREADVAIKALVLGR
jgi:hypothetical protein